MNDIVFRLVSDPSGMIPGFAVADQGVSKLNKGVKELGDTSKKAFDDAGKGGKEFGNELDKPVEKTKSLKAQLRELKAELADATDPAEIERLAKAAGLLADQIGDAADAAAVFATDSPFEAIGNSIGSVGSKLRNLDFKGAADQSKLLVAATKQLTLKEGIAGVKDLGKTFGNVGKALLMNPIFLIGAAILLIVTNFDKLTKAGGIVGAIFKGIGNAIGAVIDMGKDFLSFLGIIDTTTKSLEDLASANEKLMANIGARYDLEIAKAKRAKQNVEQLEIEKAKAVLKNQEYILSITKTAYKRGELDLKEYSDKLQEIGLAANKAQIDLINVQAAAENKRAEERKKANDDYKKNKEALTAALIDLAKKSENAELNGLTGINRLNKQKEISNRELAELRAAIQKKGELTDKNFKFTAEQEAEFAKLKLAINREYYSAVLDLAKADATNQAQVAKSKNDNALANLELENTIVKNGINAIKATEGSSALEKQTLEEERSRMLLEQEKSYQQEKLNLVIAGIDAETNIRKAGLQAELNTLNGKSDAVSKARADKLKDEIASINQNGELTKQAAITSAQNVINGVEAELNKPGNNKINWAALLGLTDQQLEELKSGLSKLFAEASKVLTLYLSLQQQTLDKEMEAVQKKKEARAQEISELESKLKTEDSLKNQGLANDSQRIKDELAVKKKEEKKALDEEKRIKKEQEKLAKDNMLVQQAVQAANLVTAIAEIFASTASGGPVGVALGYVTIAAMLASFAVAQGKVSQATNQSDSSFKDGVVGLKGPGTETSDSIKANLSVNESVITAKGTRKAPLLLEGLNRNDNAIIERGLHELLKNTGIVLQGFPNEINSTRNLINQAQHNMQFNYSSEGIERRLDALNQKYEDQKNQESIIVLPDGRLLRKKGNITTYITPKS